MARAPAMSRAKPHCAPAPSTSTSRAAMSMCRSAGWAKGNPGRSDDILRRPPGGESWCDGILRLRSMFDTRSLHYAGKRVLIVTHQVVVLCFRYLLEGLDEPRILAVDRGGDVANCAVTEYRLDGARGLVLQRNNHVTPVARKTAVTDAPDKKAAAP